MSKIVAVPSAKRPELLALTLEKLSQAKDVPEVHIYVDSVPESILREFEAVRDLYLPEAFLLHARPHLPAPSGCWNILNSIKSAASYADDVYLVEEDVLVYPYFFDWHETQTAPASCGRYHWNPKWKYRHLYTNPGSLLRRPLLDALIPHICDEYFLDTRGYLDRIFGPWHEITHLDDGLIRNVMKQNGWDAAYPEKPVCAHAGFTGLGSLDIYQITGQTLEERIERVRELIANPPKQKEWAPDWEPFNPGLL